VCVTSIACKRIPYGMKQGIFSAEQGIVSTEQGSSAFAAPDRLCASHFNEAPITTVAVNCGSNSGSIGRSWSAPWRSRSAIRAGPA
jgi:hypothetical protein